MINWKDVAIRSIKTFIEVFVTFIMAEIADVEIFAVDKRTWCILGISGVAAGVAAVWNGVISPLLTPPVNK